MLANHLKNRERLLAEYNHAKQSVKDEKLERAKALQRREDVAVAHELIQKTAQAVQQKAHKRVAAIVTKGLHTVFPNPYDFEIIFERKRGKTEARLVFKRQGHEVDPTGAAGGGNRAVAAFGLRLAALVLTQPQPRKLIVLDEPFAGIATDNAPRLRQLLLKLSEELGVQIIMTTQDQNLRIGKVVEFK